MTNLNPSLILPANHNLYGILLRIFYILLLLWCISSELLFGSKFLIIKVLPIVLCLRGILNLNSYHLQWGVIILHLYLLEGIVALTSSIYPFNLFGGVTLFLVLGAYILSLIYLNPYKKYQKQIKKQNK